MVAHLLPPQVHVFVRDWLSANHVLLKSPAGHVLVDTGYVRHVPLTLALLATPRGLGPEPLAQIVNTHCHSDHMGGNAAVARAYGCGVAVPEGEVPAIEAWDGRALLLDYADQAAARFVPAAALRPGERHVWGDLAWDAIPAPGHDMGALCFYNEEHRILISGDALWRDGFGVIFSELLGHPDDAGGLKATRQTLDRLARLPIDVVIPGHGAPFVEIEDAFVCAYQRLTAFEHSINRLARHALKVIFAFAMLERRQLARRDLPAFLASLSFCQSINARYLGYDKDTLAQWLASDLIRAGTLKEVDGVLIAV
jgi:glyoxylase-like metal-dependent hydrolase (beta-lactamase superfamily II)